MSLFYDEEDGPAEPVAGLPERLPEGEEILWQGRPSALALAIHAFHVRFILAWFIGMTAWRVTAIAAREGTGAEMGEVLAVSAGTGIAAVAIVFGLAFVMARAARFTLTNRRVVMRYGAAIRKYVNIPFARIASADLKRHGRGIGDIALTVEGPGQVGYVHLWPFVRPFRFSRPQPLLRALPEAETVAHLLARAVQADQPETTKVSAGEAASPESGAALPAGALGAT